MTTLPTVTALTLTLVAAAYCRRTGTADVPRPWLTLDRTAKVLHLECKPPLDTSRWGAVHDLKISAFLNQYSVSSNVSLVDMTSNMKEPKVHDAFTVSRVHFQGSWLSMKVSLEFLFPVTSKELGRYFCTVQHNDLGDRLKTWTTEMVVVDEDFLFSHADPGPKTVNGMTVKVRDAHQVKLTWKTPEKSKFKEASVSRTLINKEGNAIGPSVSLLTTYDISKSTYSSEVILTNFSRQDSGNFSIVLYVEPESDAHSSSYQYSCWVPYRACTGYNAALCTCCRPDTNPDTQACPTSPQETQTFFVPFVVCLVLLSLLLLFLVVVLTMYCVFKTGRYRDNERFQKIFKPKRESTNTENQSKSGSKHIEMHTFSPTMEAYPDQEDQSTEIPLIAAGKESKPKSDILKDGVPTASNRSENQVAVASSQAVDPPDFSSSRSSKADVHHSERRSTIEGNEEVPGAVGGRLADIRVENEMGQSVAISEADNGKVDHHLGSNVDDGRPRRPLLGNGENDPAAAPLVENQQNAQSHRYGDVTLSNSGARSKSSPSALERQQPYIP